jgi:hypothetical protein
VKVRIVKNSLGVYVVDSDRRMTPVSYVAGVAVLRTAGSEMRIDAQAMDVRAGLRVERCDGAATVKVVGHQGG